MNLQARMPFSISARGFLTTPLNAVLAYWTDADNLGERDNLQGIHSMIFQ